MSEDLTCKVCRKNFKFQFAREFHFDIFHKVSYYMCKICVGNTERYTYFELQDHLYCEHDENIYAILDHLNIIL